jgi:hypothetical protein
VLAATVIIPAGDLLLILGREGLSSAEHLLLHGVSGLSYSIVPFWLLRPSLERTNQAENPIRKR